MTFAGWLTNKRREALFKARTIIGGSHCRKPGFGLVQT